MKLNLHSWLREARVRAQLPQEVVAEILGVSRQLITHWEGSDARTRIQPTALQLLKLLTLYRAKAPALLEELERVAEEPGGEANPAIRRRVRHPMSAHAKEALLMSVSLIEEPHEPWPPELQALWREIEARDADGLQHIPHPVLSALADAQASPRSAWGSPPANTPTNPPTNTPAPSAPRAPTASPAVRHTASTRRVRRFWGWVENMVCFEHPQAEAAFHKTIRDKAGADYLLDFYVPGTVVRFVLEAAQDLGAAHFESKVFELLADARLLPDRNCRALLLIVGASLNAAYENAAERYQLEIKLFSDAPSAGEFLSSLVRGR